MNHVRPTPDQCTQRELAALGHAQSVDAVESLIREFPDLATPELLEWLEEEIAQMGSGALRSDWWDLILAGMLLRGYRDHQLEDALFRCWTRDLLRLGPDDVRRQAVAHPELLSRHADELLQHWLAEAQAAGEQRQAEQIGLRRGLLRDLAVEKASALAESALRNEREFLQSGSLAMLDQALSTRNYLARDANAPYLPAELFLANLQGLSRVLQERFRAAGTLADIDQAVQVARDGLGFLPEGHLVSQSLLIELGNSLNLRFRELRMRGDIDRAIEVFEGLVTSGDVPVIAAEDRLTPQLNLGVALLDRYYQGKDLADLQRSIDLLRGVLSETEAASPRRLSRANNLAAALYCAYRAKGDRDALREAITLQREVAETPDAVTRAHALAALARSLDAAGQIGEGDLEAAAGVFREACRLGFECNIGAAIWSGMTWGEAAWERGDWDGAAEAYGYCGEGARRLFRGQSAEGSQEIRLSQFREVAPRAAFALARVGRLEDAAVAFELSRAQLLNQALERGEPIRRAVSLDAEVETGPRKQAAQAAGRPTLDAREIAAAAQEEPLVYFVSTDRGGTAIAAHEGKVTSVSLPELDAKALAERVHAFLAGLASQKQSLRVQALEEITRWLWDAAMGPVLDHLHAADHIVLVPGGLLGLLPLHAAWTQDAGRPGERRYALDAAAFSYVPSVRSLQAARARAAQLTSGADTLVVVNAEAAGAQRLDYAHDEAIAVKGYVPSAEVLENDSAVLSRVSDLLSKASFAHFACHGSADLEAPLNSGVILWGDQTLSVGKIRDLHLTARLAVLSACRTGVAGTTLPDEVVALPTGFLQAGVIGVVASLWPISDRATLMLMVEFYRRLYHEGQAPAFALRGAQQWLRDTTSAERAAWFAAGAGDWLSTELAERLRSLLTGANVRTYEAPYWWAAFMHVGV